MRKRGREGLEMKRGGKGVSLSKRERERDGRLETDKEKRGLGRGHED